LHSRIPAFPHYASLHPRITAAFYLPAFPHFRVYYNHPVESLASRVLQIALLEVAALFPIVNPGGHGTDLSRPDAGVQILASGIKALRLF
jgi:hypothetical protein